MDRDTKYGVSYFARANFRNKETLFGIKQTDRRSHIYIIGKTGVGKSTLIETLVRGDLAQGHGFALIDPHGDLVEHIAADVPSALAERILVFQRAGPASAVRL